MQPPRTIDDVPMSRFHWRTALLAAGGPFCDGYILGIIGIALSLLTPQLHLSAGWIGLIGASTMLGMVVGGLLGGYVTDRIGRRAMYTLDLLAFIVLSVAQFFIAEAWQLFLLRLLLGVAVGADYPIATSYVAEFMPKTTRGPLLASLVLSWWIGYVVSFVVGYLMSSGGGDIWRWMLASSAVPSLGVLLLRIGMPESPRWLIGHGRLDEARAIVDRHIGVGIQIPEQWLAADTRQAPARGHGGRPVAIQQHDFHAGRGQFERRGRTADPCADDHHIRHWISPYLPRQPP